MAAKRRITPPVDSIGIPETTPVGNAARYNIVGASGPPVGPNPLAQLSDSLRRFNPVLGQYGAVRHQMTSEEAAAYYDELEKGVTDQEVAIKRQLQKAGAPNNIYSNPAIFKHEIISTGANFAERDVSRIHSDPEFLADISNLAKTSTDFSNDAVDLINEKYTPEPRKQEDPKVGYYWETGYAPAWIKNRDRLIAEFEGENRARREVSIKESFFEDGRNQLAFALQAPDIRKGLNDFRSFLGKKFGGFPEDKLGYAQSVMDEIILPVFLDMASDPDNELNLAAAWSKVTSMTRDNGNGGRTQMFAKYADISKRAGSQTLEAIWSEIAKTEQDAATYKDNQQNRRIRKVNQKVLSVLGNYDQWKEENIDYLKDKKVYGLDIFEQKNIYKIADALSQHPDLRMTKKEADQTSDYIFADAVRAVQTTLLQNRSAYGKAKAGAKEALIADLTEIANQQAIPLIEPLLPAVEKYIGDTDKSIDEVVHDVVYTFFNMDDMKAAVFKNNPSVESDALLFRNVLQSAVTTKLQNGGITLGRSMLHQFREAMNPENSGEYSASDWIGMASQLQDVVDEIDDTDLEADINTAIDDLNKFADLNAFYTVADRDINNMVTTVLASDAGSEIATILGLARQSYDAGGFTQNFKENDKIQAAKHALARFTHQLETQLRANTTEALDKIPPQERENLWASRLQGETQKKTVDQLTAEKTALLTYYEEALSRSDQAGELQRERLQTQLSDDNINILENFDELERQYQTDPIYGAGKMEDPEKLDASKAPQFFAGPKGLQRYSNLEAVRRDLDQNRNQLQLNIYTASNELRKSEQKDNFTEQRRHLANLATAKELYKNFTKAFDPLDWKKLNTEEGQVLEFPTEGQNMKVTFKLDEDQINLNNTLVYSSLNEIAGVAEALDAWEKEQGGEDEVVDPSTAPDDVRTHAEFIRKTHGLDLLASEPAVRKNAHAAYRSLMGKQAGLIHSRHTHLLPPEVRKSIEDQAIESYIDSDVNKFEGVEYTEDVKEWVKGNYAQNQDILEGKYNIEEGITQSQFMQLYKTFTGGEVEKRWYQVIKKDGKTILNRNRVEGFEDKEGATSFAKPHQVIAQQLALIDIGVFNPITSPNEEGIVDYDVPIGGREVIPEEITPEKYERLQERQKHYEYLLIDDKPDKHSDLAKAFNKLLIAEKGYFQYRFKAENHFGLTPLPIPHLIGPENK